MRKRLPLVAALVAVSLIPAAHAAGIFSTLPIVGNPSFCGSTVTGTGGLGGITGQGQGTLGSICGQTIPAGPTAITGNELIPADTELGGGAPPQTVTIPSGMIGGTFGSNSLVGPDFGQALWQRGTTPVNVASPTAAVYGPDGWYVTSANTTVTVSKQTGSTDVFAGTLASARIARPLNTTQTSQIQFGQLLPDDSSSRFPGNTAIFSCYMQGGANFSPTNGTVSMLIAYHSAADATSAATNGQGTNTATFASSAGSTQNITGYIEAVNSPVVVTSTWQRFSVAAAIPSVIPNTTNAVAGIGVKLQWTPTGVAGANDWVEVANCQLESRAGTSVGPTNFNRRTLADEYELETVRYYQVTEAGSGTPFYATGYIPSTSIADVMLQFPALMRITPVTSPITLGGFKFLVAGTATAPASLTTSGTTNTTPRTAAIVGVGVGSATQGQGTILTGNSGTGVLGFSAEP